MDLNLTIPAALSNLDTWLQSMRQTGGYGGPVVHWWQNRYRYTGPGLDWRYEGVLIGYARLFEKTGHACWQLRLQRAADDLRIGQRADGHYHASSFEANPASLGTPHEAAATLGLLHAAPLLRNPSAILEVTKRNLHALVAALWDESHTGFNDVQAVRSRVPNKLATLAQALLTMGQLSNEQSWFRYARAALDDVLTLQIGQGRYRGAVHQYTADLQRGDGRFFPYYNARCIPPLVLAYEVLDEPRYLDAAHDILGFLRRTMTDQGGWPQIVYASGLVARWPQWVAACGDILLAYHALGETVPEVAIRRLLKGQLDSGGFATAVGFGSAGSPAEQQRCLPDYRDLTPVVGWNDKTFRFLSELLPPQTPLPQASTRPLQKHVTVARQRCILYEDPTRLRIATQTSELLYEWDKSQPWAKTIAPCIDTR